MLNLTPEQFKAKIDQKAAGMRKLTDKQLPIVIGKAAVDHFKSNFEKQAWGRTRWKEVNRRTPGTQEYNYNSRKHPARISRNILSGDTGDMKRSLQYVPQAAKVNITSDVPYFRVHNKGLMAGRKGHQFKMPRRQSVGMDKELNQIIKDEIISATNQLLKS
ncbi:MAG: phage virion morphogenesis protein [Bacteroidales bacterium]|nr:phage virion morphogenesis protein [Bacteroidales bacterium]